MSPADQERLFKYLQERIELHRLKDELTQEMLRRSYQALDRSHAILRQDVPIVWPKPSAE
ncbi:hypothetical protein [Bradyrhizobium sp. UFLA05-112]